MKVLEILNNEKQVAIRTHFKDTQQQEHKYLIGAIHAKNGKQKIK